MRAGAGAVQKLVASKVWVLEELHNAVMPRHL
jgi:hypothetical protein